MEPRVQYVTTPDGVNIAFAVQGDGPPLIQMPTFVPVVHLEGYRLIPRQRRFAEIVSRRLSLIRYDQRGHGLSDREVADVSLDAHVGDLVALLDRLGLERAALYATTYGGPIAIAFAARHPDRISDLVLANTAANMPEAVSGSQRARALAGLLADDWELYIEVVARLLAGWAEQDTAATFAAWAHATSTPEVMRQAYRAVEGWDVSAELAQVRAHTVVLEYAQSASSIFDTRWTRKTAMAIPNAELRTLQGRELAAPAILQFLTGEEVAETQDTPPTPGGTAIILFADIVDSTALTEQLGDAVFRARASNLDAAMRRSIAACSGTAVEGKVMGDGVMAVFPSASQAIEAAFGCATVAAGTGLALHMGLHAGDVIREGNNVYGGAVNVAARICSLSGPDEVLLSDVVRTLARTSAGVTFADRGEHQLKGIEDPMRLYAAERRE